MTGGQRAQVAGGLVLALAGAITLWLAQGYAAGTAAAMGPGYFPRLLGGLLALLGLAIAGVSARDPRRGGLVLPASRPLVIVPLALLAFALTIERAGLLPATVILVCGASLASREMRARELPFLALGAAAGVWLIFVKGLGMPLHLWGGG